MKVTNTKISLKALAACAMVLIACSSARAGLAEYQAAVLADSPEAYWSFEDGNAGDILNGATANDNTANNHDGTYSAITGDGPQLAARADFGGTAAHFVRDDTNDGDFILFDTLGNVGQNTDDNGMTIEFMLKDLYTGSTRNQLFSVWNERPVPAGAQSQTLAFELNDGGDDNQTDLYLRDHGLHIQNYTFDGDDTGVPAINDGEWHHIAWVIPAGGALDHVLYVDGVAVPLTLGPGDSGETNNDYINWDKAFMLGGANISSVFSPNLRDFTINAQVDEFAIYSDDLTATQVATHFAAITIPEPSSISLLMLGCVAILGGRRKKSPNSFHEGESS